MSFRMAEKTALKSPFVQHRLGAVVVKGGRVLSTGYNEVRYTKELDKPTLHAEQAAILKLLKQRRLSDLVGATLYVTRFTRGGAIGCSRPCPSCTNLIRSVGITNVHYTLDNGGTSQLKL
jgi:deoxycytidylate deaminase